MGWPDIETFLHVEGGIADRIKSMTETWRSGHGWVEPAVPRAGRERGHCTYSTGTGARTRAVCVNESGVSESAAGQGSREGLGSQTLQELSHSWHVEPTLFSSAQKAKPGRATRPSGGSS